LLHGEAIAYAGPSGFEASSMYDYDMIVIGSGPSGRRAAVQFAKLGKSVLVVEKGRRVGGVSVHTGTIPSKTMRETVLNLSGWRERGFYGRSYRVKQDIGRRPDVPALEDTRPRGRGAGASVQPQWRAMTAHRRRRASWTACDRDRRREDGKCLRRTISCCSPAARGPFRPDYVPFDNKIVLDSDEIIDMHETAAQHDRDRRRRDRRRICDHLLRARRRGHPDRAAPTFLDFIDKELIEEFMHELRDRNVALRLGLQGQGDSSRTQWPDRHPVRKRPQRHVRHVAVRGWPRGRDRQARARCGRLSADHRGR
jgi:NAD(P) transhydrogenase